MIDLYLTLADGRNVRYVSDPYGTITLSGHEGRYSEAPIPTRSERRKLHAGSKGQANRRIIYTGYRKPRHLFKWDQWEYHATKGWRPAR